MTRAEWLGALMAGELLTGWRLQGLSFGRRLKLVFLKVVAITGYYYGKSKSQTQVMDAAGRRQPPVPHQQADEGPLQVGMHRYYTAFCALASYYFQSGEVRAEKLIFLACRLGKLEVDFVAVVVPFFNRNSRQLAQLMTAVWNLHTQTRPPDLLVLVDDGSPLPLPPNLGNEKVRAAQSQVR